MECLTTFDLMIFYQKQKCMARLLLPFILLLLVTKALKAQPQNYNQTEPYLKANSYWAWYDNNGLDFSSGVPVHDSTSLVNLSMYDPQRQYVGEGVAAVSDPISGELLFYSDGRRVWNRHHELMPNGDSLKGNWRVTTIQGTCIIPVIGNENQYYIFSLGAHDSYTRDPAQSGLYCHIVDMTLDGGNGDILAGSKNLPIDTAGSFAECMIAIPGNNCNVWLILHEYRTDWVTNPGPGNYLAYEVSSTGVNSNPVISSGITGNFSGIGHMSVSPDRSKIFLSDVMASYLGPVTGLPMHSELVLFNPANGTVSNGIAMTPPVDHSYLSGAFSPNSEVLYVSQTNRFSSTHVSSDLNVTLMQLDISVMDSSTINGSAAIVDTLPVDAEIEFPASLKLYNDSIYIFYASSNAIGRINQPDLLGFGCDFQPLSIQLPPPYKTDEVTASPPSEVVYPISITGDVLLDTAVCGGLTLSPEISDLDSGFVWSTGQTDTFLYIDTPGVYWINYYSTRFSENCVYVHTDTFIVRPGELAVRPEITINVDTLSTGVPYATYQWMFNGDIISGATSSKYVVTENGEYQVIVSDEWGCTDTSGIYEVLNVSIKSLGESAGVYIYPNPTSETVTIHAKEAIQYSLYQLDGRVLIQNKQSNRVHLSGFSDGIYLLKVSDRYGKVVHYERIIKVSR